MGNSITRKFNNQSQIQELDIQAYSEWMNSSSPEYSKACYEYMPLEGSILSVGCSLSTSHLSFTSFDSEEALRETYLIDYSIPLNQVPITTPKPNSLNNLEDIFSEPSFYSVSSFASSKLSNINQSQSTPDYTHIPQLADGMKHSTPSISTLSIDDTHKQSDLTLLLPNLIPSNLIELPNSTEIIHYRENQSSSSITELYIPAANTRLYSDSSITRYPFIIDAFPKILTHFFNWVSSGLNKTSLKSLIKASFKIITSLIKITRNETIGTNLVSGTYDSAVAATNKSSTSSPKLSHSKENSKVSYLHPLPYLTPLVSSKPIFKALKRNKSFFSTPNLILPQPALSYSINNPKISQFSRSIFDHYLVDIKKLGQGTYGSVTRAINKQTGATRAIKIISKYKSSQINQFKTEISILEQLDHPNIIKLYETYEDKYYIFLVMELCHGGDLYDLIVKHGPFTESFAAKLMKQIFSALDYMNSVGVMHRDLKPENFLLSNKCQSSIKIIDFGLSCRFINGKKCSKLAGTPFYVDPNVLKGHYDHTCDYWSAGVIMYFILCGYPPFYGETNSEVLEKVRSGYFEFPDKSWKVLSHSSKDLIQKLLKFDPKERISPSDALNHPWFKEFSTNDVP